LHHLVVAAPGSGKTPALWHAAREMLDGGDLIPIFIPLGGLTAWSEVVQAIAEESERWGKVIRAANLEA
jgi:hypothetical protein